jgi:hypothetical protein
MSDDIESYRLAFRVEGKWWVAYCGRAGTMDGAAEVARILMSLVDGNEAAETTKRAFIEVLAAAFADMAEPITGERPDMQLQDAPESERRRQ